MNNILLCCAAGMSTSLLVKKMEDEAKSQGVEVKVWAIGETDIYNNIDLADVILLGPQVRYRLAEVKKICLPKNIPVEIVNTVDYGLMNVKKVLEHALKLINDNKV
jgi:PTS system cellobiose-specific IIB component